MKPSRRLPTILFILCTGFLLQTLNGTMAVHAQQVQVNAADPPAAEQGTVNLNVKVTGKGFKNGANAKWFVTGTTDPGGVTVNSTTFVSSTEVTANITVADTAVISNFDIQVTNSDGRGGKGTELFKVTAKGGGNASCPPLQPPPTGDTKCYAALPGCLDSSFGGVGFVNTQLGNSASRSARAVVVQPDGKIVVTGTARNSVTLDDVVVARLNGDGTLDTSFGDLDPLNPLLRLGYVVTSITNDNDYASAIALQPDGKILVSGSYLASKLVGFVIRYNADGTLDSRFSGGGVVILNFGKRLPSPHYDLGIQADGKIVVGGASNDGFAAARLLPNGSLDASFGSSGLVALNPSGVSSGTSRGFTVTIQRVPAITGEERIVLAGSSKTSSGANSEWTLMRLRSNGATDTTFGSNGVVKTPFRGFGDVVYTLTIDNSNRIIAAGNTYTASSDCLAYVIDYAVVRYTENGSLDSSFGGGKQTVDFYGGRDEASFDVIVQADNKIVGLVTALSAFTGTQPYVHHFGLVRLNDDGSRDSSFGLLGNGLVTTNFFDASILGTTVALQPSDGKIVAAGWISSGPNLGIVVARYWP